jgi:hypothetical protein
MHCEQFEERLHQLLDRRLPPEADDALLAHAHLCSGCRELLEAQQTLFQSLESFEPPPTAPDFSRRVVRQAVQTRRAKIWRRAAYFGGGLAAGIVLAIFVAPRGNDSSSSPGAPSGPEHVAAAADNPADNEKDSTSQQPEVAPDGGGDSPQPPVDAYAELMESWRQQQEQFADAQKNGGRYLVALEDWGSQLVTFPRPSIEPEALPGGIKPLAESIGAALDLLQTPPTSEPPADRPQAQSSVDSQDAVG